MARSGTAIFAACLALACPAAHGQVYEFKDTPLPQNKSLHVLQLFYVFSRKEAPDAGRSFLPATVKFQGLESHSTLPSVKDADMADYKGVQVSVMPFLPDLSEVINPTQFCSTPADVQASLAQAADQIIVLPSGRNATHSQTVKFGPAPTDAAEADLPQGSVYMLVLSNCGEFQNATVSGSVAVRNTYGFLPGSEYYKMPFFGWLAIFYALMFAAWVGMMVVKYQELIHLHYYVCLIVLLGLVETAVWWMHLNTWNSTGGTVRYLSCTAVIASALKVSVAYMFILATSLGWGVTEQALEWKTNWKIEGLLFLYVLACYLRETVLSFRHSHHLQAESLVGSLVPLALLNALIFAWTFSALRSLIESISQRHQDDATSIFKSSRKVLGAAVAVVYTAFVLQVLEILQVFPVPWKYHWVLSDAVCHVAFVVALGALMIMWRPNANLHKYAYSPTVPTDENGEGGELFEAPDQGVLPDDDDDIETAGRTHSKGGNGGLPKKAAVSPDVIGLTDDKAIE